jgi:hypothetical protein
MMRRLCRIFSPEFSVLVMKTVAPGEPNLSTTNSRRFRLTPHLAELAGNRQMLPESGSLGTRRACPSASPKAPSRPFRARVSQSPVRVRVWLTGGSALESPWRFFDREPAGDGEFLKCERQVHWEEQISPSGGHLKTIC